MENIKLTPKRKEIMEKMEFKSILDVLRYYPYRHEHLKLEPLSFSLHDKKITIEGVIISNIKVDMFSKKRMKTIFMVQYDNKEVKVILFNRFGWSKVLKKGVNLVLTGKYNAFLNELVVSSFFVGSLNNMEKFIPNYTLKKEIKDVTYRNFIDYCYKQAITMNIINDIIPEKYIKKYRLISLKEAIKYIHFPENEEQLKQANRYLKYEEFLMFCLIGNLKRKITSIKSGIKHKQIDFKYVDNFINNLPFKLTIDQNKVVKEILDDLKSLNTMSRLLQGDVGSGKTVVALIALVANYSASCQGALMAPTDILAKQHYQYITTALKDLNIKVALLVSDMKSSEKQIVLEKIKNNEIDIIVGTHALIQDNVNYSNLGLSIIDEQHRFGVKQRVMLKQKGKQVDVLYMSATPIPRTLASTIYMDMDVSTIEVYPYKERKITTEFINENSIESVNDKIDQYLLTNQKIYVVCPCIEESIQELSNVKEIYEEYVKMFPNYQVGFLTGKQKSDEKKKIMNDFDNGIIQILISTTVIEVGINVMDANMMIIYNAERFGLAQIHQLRGRIARDGNNGYCYLLSDSDDLDVTDRLEFISCCNDGFKISEFDLKRRGAGDMLGLIQSGKSPFVIASLIDDFNILKVASQDAQEILKNQTQYEELLNYIRKQIRINEKYVD